jgi:hypothetical protein
MDKKNEHSIEVEEIMRRLKLAEEWLPPTYSEPAEEKWKFVAAFLLQDKNIFKRFMTMLAPRKSGRPNISSETKKYSPKRLIDLANTFETFWADLRNQAQKKGISKPTQQLAIRRFIRKLPTSLKWLPAAEGTVQKLIGQGRRMKSWPELIVDDKRRLVHPLQFSAVDSINRQTFPSEENRNNAIRQVLSLEYDRPGDLAKMQQWDMFYRLRELHAAPEGRPILVFSSPIKQIKVSTKN